MHGFIFGYGQMVLIIHVLLKARFRGLSLSVKVLFKTIGKS